MKRILSLCLVLCMVINMCSLHALAAESNNEPSFQQYSAYFQFDSSETEPELQPIAVMNDCVYVDLFWLREKFNLTFTGKDAGNYLSDEYASTTNRVTQHMVEGYTTTFRDAPEEEEYVISKPGVNLNIYFRNGSSKMYVFSEYLGEISVDLGGPVIQMQDQLDTKKQIIWMPLVMFLSILNSSFWIEDTTIHITPPSLTTVDILHMPNLDDFFYNPIEEIDETTLKIKVGYIRFYNIVKKLFQGGVSLDFKKVGSTFSTKDYEELSECLALQLCTPNDSELEMLKRVASKTSNVIMQDYSTLASTGEQISEDNSELGLLSDGSATVFTLLSKLTETIKEGTSVQADDLLSKLSDSNWDQTFDNTDDFLKAVQKASDAANVANKANQWTKNLEFGSDTAGFALPIFLTYITSANEIASSVQAYNESLQSYITQFKQNPNVDMPDELMNILDEKSKMYLNQDITIFNEELSDQIIEATAESSISFLASKSMERINSTFWQWQLVSFGWDVAEWVANGVSGGAFDSLNALNNSTAALLLECDSQQVVDQFKKTCKEFTDSALSDYKKLELIRLKSYLIAREDTLSYYLFDEKRHPEAFNALKNTIKEDEETLLKYMEALLSPSVGMTSTSLAIQEEHLPFMNRLILLSDVLIEQPSKTDAYAAYDEIINEYIAACGVDSEEWINNQDQYMNIYPDVNAYILNQFHTPTHDVDDPYQLAYMYYDIDKNSIPELILYKAYHEATAFAIFVYDGSTAINLFPDLAEYPYITFFANGVIETIDINDTVQFFTLEESGYTVEKVDITLDDLLQEQIIFQPEDYMILAEDVTPNNEEETTTDSNTSAYTNEELCRMARTYYEKHYNMTLPDSFAVTVDSEEGDTVTLHLFDNGFEDHTVTYDWYTINRYSAEGVNFLDEEIDLNNP